MWDVGFEVDVSVFAVYRNVRVTGSCDRFPLCLVSCVAPSFGCFVTVLLLAPICDDERTDDEGLYLYVSSVSRSRLDRIAMLSFSAMSWC